MPNIVIMDMELHEPLTIVNIHPRYMADFESGERRGLELAFRPEPMSILDGPVREYRPHHTHIRVQSVHDSNYKILFWYAYATDPEAVLKVRSVFLPGQQTDVQDREREAFARGIVEAFAAWAR